MWNTRGSEQEFINWHSLTLIVILLLLEQFIHICDLVELIRLRFPQRSRIPCDYENKNLSIRVEENSRRPNYLAIKLMYQGGQTDIVGVDVAPVSA